MQCNPHNENLNDNLSFCVWAFSAYTYPFGSAIDASVHFMCLLTSVAIRYRVWFTCYYIRATNHDHVRCVVIA